MVWVLHRISWNASVAIMADIGGSSEHRALDPTPVSSALVVLLTTEKRNSICGHL